MRRKLLRGGSISPFLPPAVKFRANKNRGILPLGGVSAKLRVGEVSVTIYEIDLVPHLVGRLQLSPEGRTSLSSGWHSCFLLRGVQRQDFGPQTNCFNDDIFVVFLPVSLQ
jgi:hypothetical protein